MNNLKLGIKMLLLTAILARHGGRRRLGGRLSAGNLERRRPGHGQQDACESQSGMPGSGLSCWTAVRQQKNTVISPDDKSSTEYANASKAAVANVERMILDLQKLSRRGQER